MGNLDSLVYNPVPHIPSDLLLPVHQVIAWLNNHLVELDRETQVIWNMWHWIVTNESRLPITGEDAGGRCSTGAPELSHDKAPNTV